MFHIASAILSLQKYTLEHVAGIISQCNPAWSGNGEKNMQRLQFSFSRNWYGSEK